MVTGTRRAQALAPVHFTHPFDDKQLFALTTATQGVGNDFINSRDIARSAVKPNADAVAI